MALTTQEMIDRMRIKHEGATVRLEVDITSTKEDFEQVATDTHTYLTTPGEVLTLIGGQRQGKGVHLLVVINTDEEGGVIAERLTRHLIRTYGCAVTIEWFQLEKQQAIEMWNQTIDTAENLWSINSQGGES